MVKIGESDCNGLKSKGNKAVIEKERETTKEICGVYPLFQEQTTV